MSGPGEIFSATPGVLIAAPELTEPMFHRSVVMMIEHNENGALGLILTQSTKILCTEIAEGLSEVWAGPPTQYLRQGGPVQTQSLWMLHHSDWQFDDTQPIVGGLSVSHSREALIGLLAAAAPVQLLVGYAGWGPGQLETEIARGSWILGEASAAMVMAWPVETLWTSALAQIGVNPAFLMHSNAAVQ